jgi:hypothetical protein
MNATAVDLPRCPVPDGLLCPKCGAAEFRTAWATFKDGSRHVRADCAKCGAFVRFLKQSPDAPDFRYEATTVTASMPADHPARKAPPDGWTWIGLVRLDDGHWRAVATSTTLARCWDALLHYPGVGDLLCIPSKPTRCSVPPPERQEQP